MDRHQVSALKFRPSEFATVVGQEALTTTLQHAIVQDKLAHAYLFCGPRGVGKTTCARIFAKAINCENRDVHGEPCNWCESCVSFNEQRSHNVIEMDAASYNSVDDMRLLIEKVRIPPMVGRYRVFIIDEVHMLSTAAFNAFLKTLEEPPAHAIFILATTDKHKVLPTIISRCQVFDFARISVPAIVGQLQQIAESEGIKADPQALQTIAIHADGGMRDALSIFDQIAGFGRGEITYQGVLENLNLLDEADYFEMMAYIFMGHHAKLMQLVNRILQRGFDPTKVASGFALFLRNVLLAHDPLTIHLIETSEPLRARYVKVAQTCPPSLVWRCLKTATTFEAEYKQCASQRLALEVALLTLCEQSSATLSAPPTAPIPPAQAPSSTSPEQSQQQMTPTPQGAAPPPPLETQTHSSTLRVNTSAAIPPPSHKSASLKERYSVSMYGTKANNSDTSSPEASAAHREQRNEPFTEEQLQEAWESFAQQQTTRPLLRRLLLDYPPKIGPQGEITVTLLSPEAEGLLHSAKNELMTALANTLHNDTISVQILLNQEMSVQERIPITTEEKLSYFTQHNPQLITFMERLHLRPI